MEHESKAQVSFIDTVFLQQYGLGEHNALDYFSTSQFYDPSCINEQIKMQARFNEFEASKLDHTYSIFIGKCKALNSISGILL